MADPKNFLPRITNPFGLADLGAGNEEVKPALADLDGDGDLDLLVGQNNGQTVFFRNVGTTATASFAGAASNPFGIASFGSGTNTKPALADLDGDGDLDALVGLNNGTTAFVRNVGTSATASFAAGVSNAFGLADLGTGNERAAPTLGDLDGDGDLDALIGQNNGTTVFFRNVGTSASASFAAGITNAFGLADLGTSNEQAKPALADLDGDGDLDLLFGLQNGTTVFVRNVGTSATASFTTGVSNAFGLADLGTGNENASPALGDLDGDGDLDAVVGQVNGTMVFFRNAPSPPTGLALAAGSDDGQSASDRITTVATPTVTGTATAAAPVLLYDGTTLLGSATADGAGAWTITAPTLAEGAHSLTARAVIDGETTVDSSTLVVTIDQTAPTLVAASASNDTLTLSYSEALGTAVPAAGAFAVTVDGTVVAATAVAVSGSTVTVTLAGAVAQGQTVTVSYTDPTAGSDAAAVKDLAGHDAASATTPVLIAPNFITGITNAFGLADLGSGSEYAGPALKDLDDDGDLDALVGQWNGTTVFFQNVGTSATASFAAGVTNAFGLADLGASTELAAPALGDLDGDGDLDALIGQASGTTVFFRNVGTSATASFAAGVTNAFGLVDIGASLDFASPVLGDLDGDDDLDVLIGHVNGTTVFFRNVGTSATASFATGVSNAFGLADLGSGSEYAAPALADVDGDGDLDALMGNRVGTTVLFRNIGTSATASFATGVTNAFGLADLASGNNYAKPALGDLDGDGDLDALIGQINGTMAFFRNDPPAPSGLALAPGDGVSVSDGITSVTTPTVTGTAIVGAPVQLYDGATLLGTATADAAGRWTVAAGATLAAGVHSLTARSVVAGATTTDSSALVVTVDLTGPALTAASASGNTLTLVYDEALGTAVPAAGAFTVTADGTAVAATAVAVSGSVVTLSLAGTLARGQTVTVGYTDPTAGNDAAAIEDVAGNDGPSATASVRFDPNFQAGVDMPFGIPDLGGATESAAPALGDLDGDGDLDALIGQTNGTAVFFRNVGTSASASYTTGITNPFGMATLGGSTGVAPALGDLDGDGDLDVLVGHPNGTTVLFRNIGTTATASFATGVTNPFGLTDLGAGNERATPALGDLDGDGDLDVLAGQLGGTTVFFRNVGTSASASFTTGVSTPFGLADIGDTTETAAPVLADIDGDGDLDALVGQKNGTFVLFRNIGTSTAPSFATRVDNPFGLADLGGGNNYAKPALGDLDGDGDLDVLAGQTNGTTVFFRNAAPAPGGLALAAGSDSGQSASDSLTAVTAPAVTGTATVATRVVLYDGAAEVGSATSDGAGRWTITASTLAGGVHSLTARAELSEGTTADSTALVVTIDATAPEAPGGLALAAADNSGSTADTVTSVTTPTVTGTVAEAATVILYDGGTAVGTVSAAGAGGWTITAASLSDAVHSLTAVAIDDAGNSSTASTTLTVTVDTAAVVPTGLALAAGSNSGSTADALTNVATPAVAGTTEAFATVVLYEGATALGTAAADGAGLWTVTAASLSDGAHTLTAAATDAAGNSSTASATLTVTIDTAAAAPADLALTAGSNSGSTADAITGDATPTITGTAEAAATVVLYDGATALGTAAADGSGLWTITAPSLSDGSHSLTAAATDLAGNSSAASAALVVTIDGATSAPTGLALAADSNSGSTADTVTNDTTPTVTGTAEAAATVVLYDDATALGTAVADEFGLWTITAATLSDGTRTLTAQATDIAGNSSTASATLTVTIDGATSAPTGLALAAGSNSGSTADAITNDTTPTITGTAEAFATVVLHDGATAVGTAAADGAGLWTITAATLNDGTHTLTAAATDTAGNSSAASAALTVTIDSAASAPTGLALAAASNSGSTADTVTNDTTPMVTGTAEASATVVLYDGATALGTAAADGSGLWTITAVSLSDGSHSLAATATDTAGNSSTASAALTVTVDVSTSAPTGLALAAGSNSGSTADAVTNDTTPTVTGSAEAAATVVLYDGATALGTAAADGFGRWTITAPSLSDGTHSLTAQAVDTAGNSSTASAALTVTIDSATSAPTGLALAAASNSGSTADTITSVTTPTITGTAEALATVVLSDGASAIGTAAADGSGLWTITAPSLGDGTHTLTAAATDTAGNSAIASAALTVSIDTSTPAPTGLALTAGSNSGSTADTITNVATPTITGSAEAAATVVLYDGVTALGTAAADGAGLWSVTAASLNAGTHSLSAAATDAAGNSSTASAALAVTVDLSTPAPTDLALATGSNSGSTADTITNVTTPVVTGSAEASATVMLYDGVTAVGTAAADGAGLWTITAATLGHGTHSLTAQATDAAGNSATASTALTVTVDIAAPAAPTGLALTDESNSGSTADTVTNDTTPAITGTAEALATVVLYDGATALGTAAADGAGLWTVTATALDAGTHSLTAQAVDAAGNSSTASAALAVTIDAVPPAAPTGLALTAGSNSGSTADTVTNDTTPAIAGSAEASATVVLYDGAAAVGAAAADGSGLWTVTAAVLGDGVHTLTAVQSNLSGNTSAASASLLVTIDSTGPAVALFNPADGSNPVEIDRNLVLTFGEAVQAGTGSILIRTYDSGTVAGSIAVTDATQVTLNGSVLTVNPTLSLGFATHYYLEMASGVVRDTAGNSFAGISGSTTYDFTTSTAPVSPPASPPVSPPALPPVTQTVDGVTVQQQTTTNTDGSSTKTTTIPVVTETRQEQTGNNSVADIPLVTQGSTTVLAAQVPTGVGLTVSGSTEAKTAGTSVADLIREIEAHTEEGSSDRTSLTGGGSGFLSDLPSDTPLIVQTIVPTVAASTTAAPPAPLVISAPPPVEGQAQTALVIDTRSLPSGTVIQLQNVSFAAVVGAVQVTGGDGSQSVYGDGFAQYIVLGADDDTLHGGDGADTVGSKTGDDQVYGDAGDDNVFGGDDNDGVFGGLGADSAYGNKGADQLFGNAGSDWVYGGQGNDTARGGQDDDQVHGDLGDDVAYGDLGADQIYGGAGNDTLWGGDGNDNALDTADTLFGGQGNDVVSAQYGADSLSGDLGDDWLLGNKADDTLSGGDGGDTLRGGQDDDLLLGDDGGDALWGDAGDDTLTGGAGADVFLFRGGDGGDTITDFSLADGDRIALTDAGMTWSAAAGNGGALLTLSGGGTVLLAGVAVSDVTAALFRTE